jgi:hypothetical protein
MRQLPRAVQLCGGLFDITFRCEPFALKPLHSAQLGFVIFDGRQCFANPILCFFGGDGSGPLFFEAGFLLLADLRAQSLNFGP